MTHILEYLNLIVTLLLNIITYRGVDISVLKVHGKDLMSKGGYLDHTEEANQM